MADMSLLRRTQTLRRTQSANSWYEHEAPVWDRFNFVMCEVISKLRVPCNDKPACYNECKTIDSERNVKFSDVDNVRIIPCIPCTMSETHLPFDRYAFIRNFRSPSEISTIV